MATVTLGTAATTTLTALQLGPVTVPGNPSQAQDNPPPPVFLSAADFAAIDVGILDDLNPAHPIYGALVGMSRDGRLYVPNRGILMIRAGDYVAIDATGWPILLSRQAAASASWVHT